MLPGPQRKEVLEAELARVSVVPQVKVVDVGPLGVVIGVLEVHLAPVPGVVLGGRVDTPVQEDAELGVAEPVGNRMALERGPGGLEHVLLRHRRSRRA